MRQMYKPRSETFAGMFTDGMIRREKQKIRALTERTVMYTFMRIERYTSQLNTSIRGRRIPRKKKKRAYNANLKVAQRTKKFYSLM